jgi:hypothetical protein
MRGVHILAIVLVSVSASSAMAGKKTTSPLRIDADSAGGTLTSVRGSANQVDYIDCKLGNDSYVECSASNLSGDQVTCSTTKSAFFPVVQMINKSSYLFFSWDPTTRECMEIYVDNDSQYLP